MESEIFKTKRGNPCLMVDGYLYRQHRKTENAISWLCVKEKKQNCKGRIQTNLQNEVLRKSDHSCIPNIAEIEVRRKVEKCKKRAREDISVPVNVIFKEEMSEIYSKGYDFVTETPTYSSAKTALCRVRRRGLGTTENPADANKINFGSDSLPLPNGESFLRLDVKNDEEKRILVFGGEDARSLLENGEHFFFDGTFKSCPKQFSQLYTIHVDCGSSHNETNVNAALFMLLPDKKKSTYEAILKEVKLWCPKWNPKTIKLDFETAAMNACKTIFPDALISGCNFHFGQCLWRKIQHLGLVTSYKDDEDVKNVCRMCASLAYLPREYIDEGWNIIWEKAFNIDKLMPFIDYFVEEWMDNPNKPIEMWNVSGQRHRTNNPVEGWNSRLNTLVGRKQPNIYMLVRVLKEEAEKVAFNLQAKELGQVGTKRRRVYVKLDEQIENILKEFEKSKNLEKCLKALAYVTKMQ